METIHFYGAKGGVGTSTVAALTALAAHDLGHTVLLRAEGDDGDLRAILGIPNRADSLDEITFGKGQVSLVVVDHGLGYGGARPCGAVPPSDSVYVVARNCYLSARHLIDAKADGVVLVVERDRQLTARDVEDVCGLPVVDTVGVAPTVARAIDAGLLSTVRPRNRPSLQALVAKLERVNVG